MIAIIILSVITLLVLLLIIVPIYNGYMDRKRSKEMDAEIEKMNTYGDFTPFIIHDKFEQSYLFYVAKTNLLGQQQAGSSYISPRNEHSSLLSDGFINLRFENINGYDKLSILIDSFSSNKLTKGDKMLFLFNNAIPLEFVFEFKPYVQKNEHYKKARFDYKLHMQLTSDDMLLFKNEQLTGIRISFANNIKNVDFEVSYLETGNLSEQVNAYLALLESENIDRKIIRSFSHDTSDKASEVCYLYLMKDLSNGYHKIGISNSPKFREKTLQSEKPTIEMLASKEYPTRKIALSFEQGLHKVYHDKRLRGEWFDLSAEEVKEVLLVLKS